MDRVSWVGTSCMEILIQMQFRNDSQRRNLTTKVRKGFSVHDISILEWLKWQNWFIQQRLRSVLKRGGYLNYLPLSHTHIFKVPFALFVGTSNLQCLLCPLSNCDNAPLGSCSGGPTSLCFLDSSWVIWARQKLFALKQDVGNFDSRLSLNEIKCR